MRARRFPGHVDIRDGVAIVGTLLAGPRPSPGRERDQNAGFRRFQEVLRMATPKKKTPASSKPSRAESEAPRAAAAPSAKAAAKGGKGGNNSAAAVERVTIQEKAPPPRTPIDPDLVDEIKTAL